MHEPTYWRDRAATERLLARECGECGYVAFPERRRICKRCRSEPEWTDVRLRERGTVLSYVVQRQLPDSFETPLPLAVVDVPQTGDGEPARVYGLFTETDPEDVAIGLEAVADFRRVYDADGVPVHSFKFTLPRGER
jgi:uncharacterized OB-fold protein